MSQLPLEMLEALSEADAEIMRCINAKLISFFGEDVNKYISNYAVFLNSFTDEISEIVKEKVVSASADAASVS